MKTALTILFVLAVCCAVALGGLYWWCTGEDEQEWTSRSPEALEEVREGVDDLARHYFLDAVLHFERALELDPDMPAAKIMLAFIHLELPDQRETYLAAVRELDRADMNEREAMLAEHLLAYADGDGELAARVVDEYLEEYPTDPWALDMKCSDSWVAQDWDEAESCYRRLLDADPNWVEAQGRLGFIAMARGEFDEAEELFRTFVYIAPDQAAPHAAIAQLATLRGRYDEAASEIDEALEIKDDFCEAHFYRITLNLFQRRWDDAMAALDHMQQIPACSVYDQFGVYCAYRSWIYYLQGDADASKQTMDDACLERRGGWDTAHHRVLTMTGDQEGAAELLATALQGLEKKAEDPEARVDYLQASVDHMAGLSSAAAGDWEAACKLLANADAAVQYWHLSRSAFKLRNRYDLLVCLKHQGRDEEAAALAREIAAVNPEYLASPTLTDFQEMAGVVEVP